MNYPAPTSGASPESNWFNQLRQAAKEREVLSIEGFDKAQGTDGVNFKKKFAASVLGTTPQIILPFQIYNRANLSTPADNWRTFQMRDGWIGYRPKLMLPTENQSGYPIQGNFEYPYKVSQDGLPLDEITIINGFTVAQVVLDVNADTLIQGIDGMGTYIWAQQFLANSNPDESGEFLFSVWVEMKEGSTDPSISVYPNLMARMWTLGTDTTTNRTQLPFPFGSNIFPIAMGIAFPAGSAFNLVQFQVGNLLNRFQGFQVRLSPNPFGSGGTPTITTGGLAMFRGNWDTDSLAGQVFYPGDIVAISNPTVKTIGSGTVVTVNNWILFLQYISIPSVVNVKPTAPVAKIWAVFGESITN